MALKAGRLRHRVDIQRPINVQDPLTGDITKTWETVWASVPCAIEPLSAREFIAARSMQGEINARITLRYREGLLPDMRLIHRGQVYSAEGFLPDPDSGLEYVTVPVSLGVRVE
jgi:SPP1 family predicted phage head-tail adaptor